MLAVSLHTGIEHPGLFWIIIPSILTFLAGLAIGRYADRVHRWLLPSDGVSD